MVDKYKIKIVFLSWLFSFMLTSCRLPDKKSELLPVLSSTDLSVIENGDFILRKGQGIVSSLIIDYLNDSTGFSHIGVLIKENDFIYVIHSIGIEFSNKEGVQQCTLGDFVSEAKCGEIIIVRNKKSSNAEIADVAKEYLAKNIPFDRSFDFNDTTAFSCLELPYHILERLGGNYKELVNFRAFTDSSLYEVILDRRSMN